jgi:endo-1,4-beta-xylanase
MDQQRTGAAMMRTIAYGTLAACLAVWPMRTTAQPLAKGQSKFLGNILANTLHPNFSTYWNQVTAENAGKWGVAEGSQGNYNWPPLDAIYDFAVNNGYPYKHHTLVWGNQAPSWITSLDSAAQRAAVKRWIDTVAARYPSISMVDVVNEPFNAPPAFTNALGGSGATGWDWVVTSFQWAKQAFFPGVKLILNEYNVIHNTTRTTDFLALVDTLRRRGLINAIGIQGHGFEFKGTGYTYDLNTMKSNLARLTATGLPVYISEFDISEPLDATQLQDYQTYFSMFWENPGVKGITLWGYMQGYVWRTDAYLLRSNGTERPAMAWLRIYVATPAPVSPATGNSVPRNPAFVWRRSTPATSYRIQIATDTTFTSPVVNSIVADTTVRVDPLTANTSYYWRVAAGNSNGTSAYSAHRAFTTTEEVVTGVHDGPLWPSTITLHPNFPNPFNPRTEIRFALPTASSIRLTVYNLLGTAVRRLAEGQHGAGEHAVSWDATDDGGNPVASGVYVYRLETHPGTLSRSMILLR